MFRFFVCSALLLCGCAVLIPEVRVSSAPPPGPGRPVEICRVDAEVHDRPLFTAVDRLSLANWRQVIGSVVVKHPRGVLIIDPAFGGQIAADLRQSPLWFRLVMGDAQHKVALTTLLEGAGIEDHDVRWLALTHAHWDHASGLRDLPWTKVLLSRAENEVVKTLKGHLDRGAIPRHFEIDPGRLTPFDFDGPPTDGFDRSHDLFGDGSVVAVPLPGHTPGSTGYLLQGPNGRRWLLIGDAAWSSVGVSAPVSKNRLLAFLDGDPAQTAQTLGLLHAIQLASPQLTIIPAHDLEAMETIPRCARAP